MTALLTAAVVAARANLHPKTLAAMRRRGDGPPWVRIGRSIRYPQAELELWLEKQLRGGR